MIKLHPATSILIGLFILSLCFNYLQFANNQRLIYKLNKLDSGPWKSLFDSKPIFPREKPKNTIPELDIQENYTITSNMGGERFRLQ